MKPRTTLPGLTLGLTFGLTLASPGCVTYTLRDNPLVVRKTLSEERRFDASSGVDWKQEASVLEFSRVREWRERVATTRWLDVEYEVDSFTEDVVDKGLIFPLLPYGLAADLLGVVFTGPYALITGWWESGKKETKVSKQDRSHRDPLKRGAKVVFAVGGATPTEVEVDAKGRIALDRRKLAYSALAQGWGDLTIEAWEPSAPDRKAKADLSLPVSRQVVLVGLDLAELPLERQRERWVALDRSCPAAATGTKRALAAQLSRIQGQMNAQRARIAAARRKRQAEIARANAARLAKQKAEQEERRRQQRVAQELHGLEATLTSLPRTADARPRRLALLARKADLLLSGRVPRDDPRYATDRSAAADAYGQAAELAADEGDFAGMQRYLAKELELKQ